MNFKKILEEKNKTLNIKLIITWTILLSIITVIELLHRVYTGNFAFWYDPARDLLSSLANLQKPTLIGPTSGIPGVFYGPYWIWLLSFGQLFSTDPRLVTFIVATIPYLVLFPIILSKFNGILRPTTIAILWLLFLLHYNDYFTSLWNPHPAPLLMIATILLLFLAQLTLNKKNMFLFLSTGFASGLLVNFHLSLGIGMMLGIIFYLLIKLISQIIRSKTKLITLMHTMYLYGIFIIGFIAAFGPYILFEIRHQFQQTQAFLAAFVSFGGIVTLQGLSPAEIVNNFIERGANLINLPISIFIPVFILLVILYINHLRQSNKKNPDLPLLSIALSIFTGISIIYLTAKNPIWDYHFIGIEILFMIIIGVLINKNLWVKAFLSMWIVVLICINAAQFFGELQNESIQNPGTLAAKQHVVQGIIADAGTSEYVFYSLNPSIYMFDYSYLFKQLGNKDISYDPGSVPQSKNIYLIIPPKSKDVEDFINYRAPKPTYKKEKQTTYPDGTLVIRYTRIQ